MKKVLVACFCLAALGMIGCGDPCGELADKMRECCAKYTDATAKSLCEATAKAVEEEGEDCDPDAFTCTAQ